MHPNLPEKCFSNHPVTGQVIAIKRGESGYYPIMTASTSEKLNEAFGVTKAQAEAMLVGSMFGWGRSGRKPGGL